MTDKEQADAALVAELYEKYKEVHTPRRKLDYIKASKWFLDKWNHSWTKEMPEQATERER